jgi:hypothetical protein
MFSHLEYFVVIFVAYLFPSWYIVPGKFGNPVFVLDLTKNGLGHILGDFFQNSSGHPVCTPDRFTGSAEIYSFLRRNGLLRILPEKLFLSGFGMICVDTWRLNLSYLVPWSDLSEKTSSNEKNQTYKPSYTDT